MAIKTRAQVIGCVASLTVCFILLEDRSIDYDWLWAPLALALYLCCDTQLQLIFTTSQSVPAHPAQLPQ